MTNLAQLMGGEKSGVELTRDIDPGWGFTFSATFDPTAIPTLPDGIYDDNSADDNVGLICQVVKKWDLVGPVPFSDMGKIKAGDVVPEGKPIPIKPEVVGKFPPTLIGGIIRGILAESFPKSRTNPTSETPSE